MFLVHEFVFFHTIISEKLWDEMKDGFYAKFYKWGSLICTQTKGANNDALKEGGFLPAGIFKM